MQAVTDAFLKTTSDLVFHLGVNHTIEQLSGSVPRFYFSSAEDFLGKEFEAAFTAKGLAAPISRDVITTPTQQELTKEISNGYGKIQRIKWIISPLGEGTLLIGTIIAHQSISHLQTSKESALLQELRTRLSIINLATRGLQRHLPRLLEAYEIAKQAGQTIPCIPKMQLNVIAHACDRILEEVWGAGRVVKRGIKELKK